MTDGIRLGVTFYSFTPEWHSRRCTFDDLMRRTAELGIGPGVEFVGFEHIRGFPKVDAGFAHRFRDAVERYELVPACLDGQVDLGIRSDRMLTTDETFEYCALQIEAARTLGFPALRLQYGGFAPVAERVAAAGEAAGVKVGIEVHAPHTLDHPDVVALRELCERVDTPYLGFIPDLGASTKRLPRNFLDGFRLRGVPSDVVELVERTWNETRTSGRDPLVVREELQQEILDAGAGPYAAQFAVHAFRWFGSMDPAAWAEIVPLTVHVHAKFYEAPPAGGPDPYIDLDEVVDVFATAGYEGFFCSEYEAWQWEDVEGGRFSDGFAAVVRHHEALRRALSSYEQASRR